MKEGEGEGEVEGKGERGKGRGKRRGRGRKRSFKWLKCCSVHQSVVLVSSLLQVALDPPIRQGQTRYYFVIFLLPSEDECEVALNLSE